MEDPAVATGISLWHYLRIIANTTADQKILYMPVGWEGWSFIAVCSNLALKLLHQFFLRFLGGLGEVSKIFDNINTVTRTNP